MTLQVAVSMRYLHERYFGRPACPKCGELMMASQSSEYVSRHNARIVPVFVEIGAAGAVG